MVLEAELLLDGLKGRDNSIELPYLPSHLNIKSEVTCEMRDSLTRDLTASRRSSQVQWTRWYSMVGTCSRKLATSRILFFSFSPLYETQIGTSETHSNKEFVRGVDEDSAQQGLK